MGDLYNIAVTMADLKPLGFVTKGQWTFGLENRWCGVRDAHVRSAVEEGEGNIGGQVWESIDIRR